MMEEGRLDKNAPGAVYAQHGSRQDTLADGQDADDANVTAVLLRDWVMATTPIAFTEYTCTMDNSKKDPGELDFHAMLRHTPNDTSLPGYFQDTRLVHITVPSQHIYPCEWDTCTALFPNTPDLISHVHTSHLSQSNPSWTCLWRSCHAKPRTRLSPAHPRKYPSSGAR